MNGRRGYVPCNMVEEYDQSPPAAAAGDSHRGSQSQDKLRFSDSLNTTGSSQGMRVKPMMAI